MLGSVGHKAQFNRRFNDRKGGMAMPIYLPGQAWEPGSFASILAIGDSWFWYPNNNILGALVAHPSLKDPYRNIQMLGFNGAKLHDYVFGKYKAEFTYELEPINSQYYSAVLISGAGNDAVEYRLALKDQCRGLTSAADCFDPAGTDDLLQEISRALSAVIHDVSWEISKQNRTVDIFLHGYDYSVPDGRGFQLVPDIITIAGPWLKSAMDAVGVLNDMNLRKDICRILIDRLNGVFLGLNGTSGPGYRVNYIDSRGVLDSGNGYQADWANELHPTPSGFNKIVDQRWIPAFRNQNLAT
jgi:hypothetical protein